MPVISRRALISGAAAAFFPAVFRAVEPPLVVSKHGDGFRTIQEAIDAIPRGSRQPRTIEIRKGTYIERVTVPRDKPFTRLVGEDARNTVVSYNLSTATTSETRYSASTYVFADNFEAENLAFENAYGVGSQAVALFVGADRAVFRACRFLGWQDTLYINGPNCQFVPQPLTQTDANNCAAGRQFFDRCYVEGHVDFIFGDAAAVFRECEIHSKGAGYLTAQSRTYPEQTSGFVFVRCRLTGENPGRGVYLGRPWRAYSQVVYQNCWLGPHIRPEGWSVWKGNNNHETAFYAEYESEGPGANPAARVLWSHQLTTEQAARFALPDFLKGTDGWNPGGLK
jgi:pectinesterase